MSKQIWLSPVLGNSRERLVGRCAEMVKRGDAHRFVYLTASHPMLELVTKWILDSEKIRGLWGTLPVFLFRGFVRHILNTATDSQTGSVLSKRIPIDGDTSHLKKSLLSQVMRSLVANGKLKALAPLAHRDGTVNTISTLMGEIQRAAKGPEEFRKIVEARASDLIAAASVRVVAGDEEFESLPRQLDFDREIGLIYEAYTRALDQFQLTEADADQLRVLRVLGGEVNSMQVALPWLADVELLVVDGFFDFTPVQGEILRKLIPQIPDVIVNLYGDKDNAEVFRPFADTIEQVRSMSEGFGEPVPQPPNSNRAPAVIRTRLFNPEVVSGGAEGNVADVSSSGEGGVVAQPGGQDARAPRCAPRVFRCSDRETEIREIAKEIKRLVLLENFSIREIALVVRQRAAYSETIARVLADEAIPCNVERTVSLVEVPAVRAVLKLFQILSDERDATNPRVTDLADLIKAGYFRLSEEKIRELRSESGPQQEQLIETQKVSAEDSVYGSWNPDALENVFAYVGSDLRLEKWLERAKQLSSNEASAIEVRSQIFSEDIPEQKDDEEEHDAEEEADDSKESDQPAAPTRELPPLALEWAAMLLREFAAAIGRTPRDAEPRNLRVGILTLLDELQFANTIRRSVTNTSLEAALPHAALDLRALEGIRLAMSDAIKSIEIVRMLSPADEENPGINIEEVLEEIERCIGAQSLMILSADRDGLQVLEATDVRGLQFRAIFIAGLIEGGFPLRKPRDWIYPHEERERLKEYGLTLEDISPATLLKEEHYFYQAASRATEHLYLTWPLVLEGGNETVVSYYIDELTHALEPLEIKNEEKRRDFDGNGIFESSSRTELAAALVRLSERHLHRGKKSVPTPLDDVDKLVTWAEQNEVITTSAFNRIAIGRERAGDRFGRYDGLITNTDLRDLLADRFGPDYIWSASALSLFGKSPYKFFAERVLKLEPRIEAALDLAAMDAGGLLHEALRRFFTKHRAERLLRTDRLKLRAQMRSIADQVFRARERVVPPLNINVWKIDREIHQLQLARVVDYEIELQNQDLSDGVLPTYFELGFGMNRGTRDERSTPDFLYMLRDDKTPLATDTIRLRGQIDRVDIAKDGTVIAYDYKLSRGAKLDDMVEGRDLQIGVYLDAIENLFFPNDEIAGGGYYVLRTCDRNRGLYRKASDKYTHLSTRVGSRLEDDRWFEYRALMRKRIWQFVDWIRAGRFVVDPTAPEQTCDLCDFAVVCRYEKFRILRKFGVR